VAVRKVLSIPDSVLSEPAAPVSLVDDHARALAEDLFETMRVSPACVGLAAPQIGVGLQALVVDVTGHRKARSCHGPFALFDPVVVTADDPRTEREGCMSVPDLTGDVERSWRLAVSGLNLQGEKILMEFDAFEARAVAHEIDHLLGLVFLDRVIGPHAVFPRRVYR